MTLMRLVVSSDFFAINLTPEEARPGPSLLAVYLSFWAHSPWLRQWFTKHKDAGITSSGKITRKPSYFYESCTKQRSGFQRSIYKKNPVSKQGDKRDCSNKTMIKFTFYINWRLKSLFWGAVMRRNEEQIKGKENYVWDFFTGPI